MMDIVELLGDLREEAKWGNVMCGEAADEIERLREALQHIADDTDEGDTRQFALSVLQQKENEK